MYHNKRIAVILPDTLRSIGIQTLLADYFPPVEISPFPTFGAFAASDNENYDYYFTDADRFVQNADFFLPRRAKTMVLTDSGGQGNIPPAINLLTLLESQEALLEQLGRFFASETSVPASEGSRELSARETDVLRLIVKGGTNKEIAERLSISLNTVLTHRKNITSKLGIKTVSGLTFYAIMNGFVSGEEIGL